MVRLFSTALVTLALLAGGPSSAHADAVVDSASDWITSNYPEVRQSLADRIARTAWAHTALNGLPFNLFLSLIAVESGFNPKAHSSEGAKGLTQVMVKHHSDKVRGRDLSNPDVSIEVGAVILRDCYTRFQSTNRALRCYSGYQGKSAQQYIARIEANVRSLTHFLKRSDRTSEEQAEPDDVTRTALERSAALFRLAYLP